MASISKREWTYNGETKSAWEVRYKLGDKHPSKQFKLKKDAEAFRQKVERELAAGSHRSQAGVMTVEKLLDEFNTFEAGRRQSGAIGFVHMHRTERHARLHIRPHLGHLKLADVDLVVLSEWARELTTRKKLNRVTAAGIVAQIKRTFDFAERRRWVFKNPVDALMKERRGQGKAPNVIRTFTVEEMRALINTANVVAKHCTVRQALLIECFVNLGAFCGLRLGEIIGLTHGCIDFPASQIHVRHSFGRYDGLKGTKTKAGERVIGLPQHISALLSKWVGRFAIANDNGLVFTTRTGHSISGDSFRMKDWGQLLKRAGLCVDHRHPTFHFHALRHFAASWRIDAGWSLPMVARELGHSRVEVTMSVYAHALKSPGSVVAAQALVDRFRGVPLLEAANSDAHDLRNNI